MKNFINVVVVVISCIFVFSALTVLETKNIKDDNEVVSTRNQYRMIVEDGNFAVIDSNNSKAYADLVENTCYEAETGDIIQVTTTTFKSGRKETSQAIVGSYAEGDLSIYSNCGLAYATYIDGEGTAHNFNLWAVL